MRVPGERSRWQTGRDDHAESQHRLRIAGRKYAKPVSGDFLRHQEAGGSQRGGATLPVMHDLMSGQRLPQQGVGVPVRQPVAQFVTKDGDQLPRLQCGEHATG